MTTVHKLDELVAALPDALRIAAFRPPRHPHHLAAALDLRDVLDAVAASEPRLWRGRENLSVNALRGAAMNTAKFGSELADAARLLLVDTFTEFAAHRVFCARALVPSFVEHPSAIAEFNTDLNEISEGQELGVSFVATRQGVPLRLRSYGAILVATRHAIVNDDRAAVAAAFAGFPLNAARLEANAVAGALTANADLSDNAPVFDAGFGNDLGASAEPDAAGIALAMGALRSQETGSGQMAGHELRHLVVAADCEFVARKEVHVAGLADRVTVTAMSALADGTWFALADPALAPTAAIVGLEADQGRPSISVVPTRLPASMDGVGLKIRVDLGAAMVGRVGIVRGGV